MNKVELFNEVLDNVCKGTELDTDSVKSSNREECVDARYLVIAILSEKLSDKQIAEVSGWSVQLVNKAKNSFHNRCKCRWGLKELYKELSK
jgi:arginine/ornithine N-succinyltransferase beta subunit